MLVMLKPTRYPLWCLLGLLGLVSAFAIEGGPRSYQHINSYYGKLLQPRELKGIRGPHFWKNGRIFWAGDDYLKSSGDDATTFTYEEALPKAWEGPARFVSEAILADRRNVYVKVSGRFQKVLSHFRCWYVCGASLSSGDFVIGEYGNRIYRVDSKTGEATLILEKPAKARHFHVTAVDPFTNDIYTSLGDALKQYAKFGDRVTGIMRSQDEGKNWKWLYKTVVGLGPINRQPTAIYFDREKIFFGSDSKPHGIFVLDRTSGIFEQVFSMPARFRSWFTQIEKANGSYWAVSRAFARKGFGFLWWSGDGKAWTPVRAFEGTPVWLQTNDANDEISVGFFERDLDVVALKIPDATQMAELVSAAPGTNLAATPTESFSLLTMCKHALARWFF